MEETETIETLNRIGFKGRILNIAAGDGRFNEKLLNLADEVVAVDRNESELKELEDRCPKNLKNKLFTQCMDITKKFPFEENTFDGIFCTGTLHLFNIEIIESILREIKRVLKNNGKILLDFATDISRLDGNNNPVIFEKEGSYTTGQAIELFEKNLKDFEIKIEKASFREENLQESAGYHSIVGNFLIITGESRIRTSEIEER